MRNPFRRREKALTGSPEVVSALNAGWSPWPSLAGGAQQRVLDIYNRAQSASYGWMYSNSPAVRTVIDLLVRNVGQLELRLYEEVGEAERQPQPDHPAAMSLRYPNEVTSADKFIRSMFKDYLIFDNAFALITPAPDNQLSFTRIPAYMVVVQGASLFDASNYRVWPMGAWTTGGTWGGAGTWKDFTPDEIMHWHGEAPLDPRVGLSVLDTIRDVIAEDAALQQATVELAKSGLMEPSWVYRPLDAPDWSTAARRAMEEDLTNRMRDRHRKPVMLSDGMEMRSFGVSPRDAQMYEIRRWAIERVASIYGVPLGMVGLDPNVSDARQEFLTDTLPPLCGDFTSMLNQRILVRAYDDTKRYFEFNLDEKSVSQDAWLQTLTSASGRPVLLTNEARARLNLPPVEDGDELVTPLNVVVGENPKPSVAVNPIQDPNKPPQDGTARSDQPPTPIPAGGNDDEKPPPKAMIKQAEYEPITQLLPRRAQEMDRQHENIDAMRAVVQRHFNRMGRVLTQKAITNWDRWDREFSDDLDTALKAVVRSEGTIYAFRLGGQFDMGRVQNYLKAMAEGAAGAINDTFRSEIDQMGLKDAMARTSQHVASAGASLGAHSTIWAREEAARQAPDPGMRIKTWIADTGRHAEYDGDTVPLADDWPSGFAPGQEPGCACSESIT